MTKEKEPAPYIPEKVDDYQQAWGCSKREALYSTPYEDPHESHDCYEDNQWY